MMKTYLLKLARWIARRYGYILCPQAKPEVLEVVTAVGLRFDGSSGESKRHQALALLLKQGFTEREAAMQIELAVNR